METLWGLISLRREMDNLWNLISSDFPALRRREGEWAPEVDVSEDKENFIVQAELPGMEGKEVNVTISGNMLTVKNPDLWSGFFKRKSQTILGAHAPITPASVEIGTG